MEASSVFDRLKMAAPPPSPALQAKLERDAAKRTEEAIKANEARKEARAAGRALAKVLKRTHTAQEKLANVLEDAAEDVAELRLSDREEIGEDAWGRLRGKELEVCLAATSLTLQT